MNPLAALQEEGQSIWYDFISRDFIKSGEMKALVDKGVRGMTSNPTIFEKAIAKGNAYDEQISDLGRAGRTTDEIATELFVTDVRNACDVMRPVFDGSNGADGFISIEVNPRLAAHTEATIAEALQLWARIDRPNLMIKIPATPEGMPAIRRCIADGLNINITLMFSLEQYRNVAEAYIAGLEDRLARGMTIRSIHSVASVFVSRIDSMVDAKLEAIGTPEALALRGRAALANTKLVYAEFEKIFAGARWQRLAAEGANIQRPLWASTSTKNPEYSPLLYVDTLIGPNTVNTVPPETLEAIQSTLTSVKRTVDDGVEEAPRTLEQLAKVGVDMEAVMAKLIEEGVEKFEKSFDSLFEKLDEKRSALAE
ncbi:MAG TPA: transaldolase [Candidatus Kapabacteria bacterium]|nr:transaldolase [Candidatus Kapabacteria bacterium]